MSRDRQFELRTSRLDLLIVPIVLLGSVSLIGISMLIVRAFTQVSFDWGEGWNAFHAAAAMLGEPLYPAAPSLMFNNYPPLSFYFTGVAGLVVGDNIVAGRLLSIVGVLGIAAGVAATARFMGCRPRESAFAALFVLAQVLAYSDFVGVNAPQLFAQAIGTCGFAVLTRSPRTLASTLSGTLLLATAFFTKHMLIAQPVSIVFWLLVYDRRSALRTITTGLAYLVAGLFACGWILHANLLAQLTSARDYDAHRMIEKLIVWVATNAAPLGALPILVRVIPRDRFAALAIIYLVIAIMTGGYFHGGAGVLSNAMFDANIAISLISALVLNRGRELFDEVPAYFVTRTFAIVCVIPQLVTFGIDWPDKWRPVLMNAYQTDITSTRIELNLLRATPDPVLCDTLALCFWAQKKPPVDLFNLAQAMRHRERSERELVLPIAEQHFRLIQLGV